MNRNTKIRIAYIALATAIAIVPFCGYKYAREYADVIYDDQGRIVYVDGADNLTYPMYDKYGNFVKGIKGYDLRSRYNTDDIAGAAERYATENGYVYVPKGTSDKQAYIAQKVGAVPQDAEAPLAEQSESTTEPQSEIKTEEKPKYEHGIYNGITEDALNAFDYFTVDGVADSCYIQIEADAEQRTMPGSHISKTAANSEYGEVQFVNENEEVVYKFVFPQVKADADFAMELTPTIEDVDEGIKVDFKDEKLYNMDLGFEVDFFFQTGKPGTKLYVYTSEADGLHEYNTITTDADGFARLPYTMVQDYTFSETDLVAAAEEAKAKAQAEAEAKKLEEEANKATEDQVSTPAEEIVTEEEPIEPVITGKSSVTPYVLVGVVALTLVAVGIVVARRFIK